MDNQSQRAALLTEGRTGNIAPVRVCLLGGLRVEIEGGVSSTTRFQTQKTAALLAFLALQPARAHSREFLADLLWPDADEEKGRRSLRVALTSLRRQLEPPGVPVNLVLVADRTTVRLNFPTGVQTDVARFEQAAAGTTGDTDTEESLLDEALTLYAGPLLPGFYDDWAIRERERLVDLYRSLLLRRAQLAEKREAFAMALDYARRAVHLEEDREATGSEVVSEDAHLAVIQLLTRTGRHDDARRQYNTLTRRLSDLYDEAPSPKARALLERLPLPGNDTPFPQAPRVSLAPALSQLALGIAPSPPPSVPLRLPLMLSRFFGRGPEMDQVHNALYVAENRLVTLTGPGGSGKTRLAVEFARRFASAAKTGAVFFAPLADIEAERSLQIWTAIADAVGIERGMRPAETKPLRSLVLQILLESQGSDNPCLLVLDNFEPLVDTGGPLVAALLESVPHLHILVTSRRRLGLPGEQEVPVTPLPVPTLPGTPERLMEWSSVQLFVDRAQTARSDFQITARNSEVIANLCCRLDGIPLALELTAAWAGVLSPSQMLQRAESQLLDEAGPPLAYHRARRAERHRTLRAAIDSSFTLLSPELREAFTRLSVFRGGWTLEAAEHLLMDMASPAADLLARLRERSLLVAQTSTDGESVRFRMLHALREFADERLSPEQNDSLRDKCAAYFAEYAAVACRTESRNQSRVLACTEADYPNFSAAVDWLAERQPLTEGTILDGLKLTGAIGWYWLLRGYTKMACDRFRHFLSADCSAALSADSRTEYINTRLVALLSAAQIAMRVDRNDESEAWGKEALALSLQGYGSTVQRIVAYNTQGIAAMNRGDYPVARANFEAALGVETETAGSPNSRATLTNLGLVCWYQGDFPQAEAYFETCLKADRASGDSEAEARDLLNLGLIACVREELERSQAFLEASLGIRREMKDLHGLANVLGNLGEVLFQQKKEIEAREALTEALTIARSLNDSQQVAYALGILGMIALQQEQFGTASELLEECVSLFVTLGDRYQVQNALEAYASFAFAAASSHLKGHRTVNGSVKSCFERAARFWAAAQTLREAIGVSLLDKDRALRDEKIAETRTALGGPAFDAQQAVGRTLSLGDLVLEAQSPF